MNTIKKSVLLFSYTSLFAFNLHAMNEAQRLQANEAARLQARNHIIQEFHARNPDKTLCDIKIIACEDENPGCDCGTLKRAELTFRHKIWSWHTLECMATGLCVGGLAGGALKADKDGFLYGGIGGTLGGLQYALKSEHVSMPIINNEKQVLVPMRDPGTELLFAALQFVVNQEEVQEPPTPSFNPEIVEVDRRTVGTGLSIPAPTPEMLAALSSFRALQ